MSSSHCLGKVRDSRRDRVSIRRATVPDLANGSRETHVLFDAVNVQDYDRVLDLLQSGVDPCISDRYGRTPLHVASTKMNAAIAKALIDHGANFNAEDSLGNTPLHLACISSRLAIVGILLRAGANLSSTKSRSTPLTIALSRLQSMMNEKRTIASPEIKAEIIEVCKIVMPAKKKTQDEQQSNTKKTLFLIRHGQSISNRDYDESSAYRDAGLTEQGISQARALHKELEELEIELAVVSPLTRALQTCQNALPPSYDGPIIVLPEIAEVCSSHYSCGQKRSVIQPKFPTRFDWSNVPMDDVWWWPYDQKHASETHDYQTKRMQKFRHFVQARPETRIAVFSHGDYLWEFLEGGRSYPANCQVITYKM
ncbi:unnamed protein product [Rotaria socialis]